MDSLVDLVVITPNAEALVGYCARVSNPANQDKPAGKLLKYMIDHKHWSPFEMANMVVEITTSRAISAQILRHRSFSFQEFSQRYASVQEFVEYPARRQDEKNRQNSLDDLNDGDRQWFFNAQAEVNALAMKRYADALKLGVAKECARFLLPMSSKTTLYMNGNLRSWIHYIQLRTDESVQLEHREIAKAIKRIFMQECPIISEALEWIT
jgi:thymidylate synthase (FAD)